MRHKNYDMIVAKAANMDLVVLSNYIGTWFEMDDENLNFFYSDDYFLCLPQHKETCLHWLGGGEIQDYYEGEWTKIKGHDGNPDWNERDQLFTNEEFQLRIAPKKEKQWIGVYGSHVTDGMHPTKELCERHVNRSDKFKHCAPEGWQFIEIEIEA